MVGGGIYFGSRKGGNIKKSLKKDPGKNAIAWVPLRDFIYIQLIIRA